jgi:hypothetical protein
MDNIVLEVDDASGMAYRKFSAKTKQEFNRLVSLFLKKAVNDADSANYQKLLDDMGDMAAKNGLTPAILNELLAADD